jgi:hypothetical protein
MAARPKRVSVRGRGADLFFGDFDPADAPPPPDQEPAFAAPQVTTVIPVADDAPEPGPPVAITAPPPVSAPPVAGDDEERPETPSLDEGPIDQVSKQASKHVGKRAIKQASNKTSKADASLDTAGDGALDPGVLGFLWENLVEQATLANTFRYTEQELDWLADALYEITKRHRARLTKQDIARLGLNAVLWDYRVRGDASLLGEFVRRRQRAR